MRMSENWDWLEKIAIIVGLIWAIIAVARWIWAYIIRTQLKGLEGTWHEYHWTNPDGKNTKFKWLHSTLKAKSRFFSSYKLFYENSGNNYAGTARYIDKRTDGLSGDILLKVQKKSSRPKSTIYFRYNIPERQFGNNNDEITGIWLSYNFDKDITSGASILSQKEIPQNELEAKFKEYFVVDNASIIVKNNGKNEIIRKYFWEFWK